MTNDEHKAHLAALPEPVREAREELPAHAQEVLNWPRDLHEYASECALNDFRASLDLLIECSPEWESEAEELCEGREWSSWRDHTETMGEIVYQISVRETVSEALESYRETAREALAAIADMPDVDGTEDEPRPTVAALERDLAAIDTILS
jgi:hypothetical protein